MYKCVAMFIFALIILFSCEEKTQFSSQTVNAEYFSMGPQLVKIPIDNKTNVDSLISSGMEIIVVEKNYIISRVDQAGAANIQAMSLSMETFPESDLVQRLIRVIVNPQSDFETLNTSGIDIWEVKGDTVIAQAFDIQIRQIEKLNYDVEILEPNIQNLTKKPDQK